MNLLRHCGIIRSSPSKAILAELYQWQGLYQLKKILKVMDQSEFFKLHLEHITKELSWHLYPCPD